MGRAPAVRQNLGAESSRNENESTVCGWYVGLANFALRLRPLVLFSNNIKSTTTIITFSFLVLFSFSIHIFNVNSLYYQNLKAAGALYVAARTKTYAKF